MTTIKYINFYGSTYSTNLKFLVTKKMSESVFTITFLEFIILVSYITVY
jgi:hypothetical protein